MITESKCELFAMLCEGILLESTIISILGNSPRATALAKEIHKQKKILHNSPFIKTNRVEGGLARSDARIDYHYLIIGENNDFLYLTTKGNRGGDFHFMYVDKDRITEEHTVNGLVAAKKYITEKIGKISRIYQYTRNMDTEAHKKHRIDISKRGPVSSSNRYDLDRLYRRFKPMFMRTLLMAEAEMKGMLMTMVRNGYYNEAVNKANRLKTLSSLIYTYEQDTETNQQYFKDKIYTALVLTGKHVFPDMNDYEAADKLLESLTKGNMQHLLYVLMFFKNTIMRGIS